MEKENPPLVFVAGEQPVIQCLGQGHLHIIQEEVSYLAYFFI